MHSFPDNTSLGFLTSLPIPTQFPLQSSSYPLDIIVPKGPQALYFSLKAAPVDCTTAYND